MPCVFLFLSAPALADDPAPEATGPDVSAPAETERDSAETGPPPAEDPDAGWISIEVPRDFGSALDTVGQEAERIATEDEGLFWAAVKEYGPSILPRAHLRGRLFVRPLLSAVGLAGEGGGWTMTTGAVVGHQWWAIEAWRVKPVGETQFSATFPVAGAAGQDLRLVSLAGVWAGPVGLLAGPALRWDRLQFPTCGEAKRAWTLGPEFHVAAHLGPLTPWVSVTPAWVLGGRRVAADTPVGDEIGFGGGLEISARPVSVRFSGSFRELAAGVLWEGTVGLHLRVL